MYIRIISVQNADRLLLDDFELTGYTLGLDTPHHPVLLYPNPASHVVYIQGSRPPEKVQLYTLNGQLVDEHLRSKAIPVRDLHSGVYLVKIHTGSQVLNRKLVVY
ncbi:MAG: T9SS type A sorting domain-containing protein [Flavobacteriaceae bacterium]